jgi:hypothetical protein
MYFTIGSQLAQVRTKPDSLNNVLPDSPSIIVDQVTVARSVDNVQPQSHPVLFNDYVGVVSVLVPESAMVREVY